MDMTDKVLLVILAILIILILIFGPLISIWALNTLFALSIPYTFWTWLAMFWVGLFFNSAAHYRKE